MAEADDVWALLERALTEAGLDSLLPRVKEWITSGITDSAELELRVKETAEYRERTKVNEVRKQKGLPPLSLGEIVAAESAIRSVMREAGLPSGFYDEPDDFVQMIGNDLSASEIQSRVELARAATYDMDPQTRVELFERYGLDEGSLTAFYLDPDRAFPLLDRQQRAARVAAEAARQRVSIGTDLAEQLVQRGVDAGTAAAGFERVGRQRGLTAGPGETITQEELIAATFGTDGAAAAKARRVANTRQAAYQGGGGVADSQQGVVGLGRG